MPERVPCNLCGADNARPLFRLRDYRLQIDDVEWTAMRCRRCGLGYLSPRPAPDEIERYYPARYFSGRERQTARYERQATYLPPHPGRLLDIGTAEGDFLLVARELGWEAEGTEGAAEARNPHDLRIHRTWFPDDGVLPTRSYDVVTAWAVFEHLFDPKRAFARAASLLRPGGTLVIQVPNLRSIHTRWALLEDVPRHLYFFSPPVLRRYGVDAGLELERVAHTTDLFGGSGRGVLRLALVRASGGSVADFFAFWRTPRRERFRRRPVLAAAWTATAAVERVLLADWLVRTARISGQIVATFRKPEAAG
jgi:SAM-dependent methyltransferase